MKVPRPWKPRHLRAARAAALGTSDTGGGLTRSGIPDRVVWEIRALAAMLCLQEKLERAQRGQAELTPPETD